MGEEEGTSLFVYVVLVFCMSSMGAQAINHTVLSDTDLAGCLLAHFNTSTETTEV